MNQEGWPPGVLCDRQIEELSHSLGMISPFEPGIKRPGKISYGLTHTGYDCRLGLHMKVLLPGGITDPKQPIAFGDGYDVWLREGQIFRLEAQQVALVETVEFFRMPADVTGWVANKSTWVRCGISLPFTILEPGWNGCPTFLVANHSPRPVNLYAGEGLCQVLFTLASKTPSTDYAAKEGKYQGQSSLTTPKVD